MSEISDSLPDEAELEPSAATGSPHKATVWDFYKELWNKADVSQVPRIFHEDFTFRGSLGPVLTGHAAFSTYVTWLTATLERYTCDILAMIEEGDSIAARMRFHGFHRKPLFGVAPTGKHVWWHGVAIFKFDGDKVRDLWVLGDIHGLLQRLNKDASRPPELADCVESK